MPISPSLPRLFAVTLCLLLLAASSVIAAAPTLDISGVKKAEEANIRALINPQSLQCNPPQWRHRQIKKHILTSSQKALRALGYYHPQVSLELTPTEYCTHIEVKVIQGPPVIIKKVTIEVSGGLRQHAAFAHFISTLSLESGHILRHDNHEKTRIGIEQLAARLGYFEGTFTTRRMEVNTDTNEALIILEYTSGSRYKLGEITVKQAVFNPELIAQFTVLQQDEYYDSQDLIAQQQTFNDSALFAKVDVVAHREARENLRVPVTITLEARKRTAHRFGIGASTDVGPRISYKLDRRWINKRGHSGGINFSLSPSTRQVTTHYSQPLAHHGQTRFDFQTGYLREISESSESESYKLAASKTQLREKNWTRTFSIEYLRENFTTGDTRETTDLLMPGARWSKLRADNALFPRDGWRLRVRLRAALEGVISDTDLAQMTLGTKFIKPLGKGRVLARLNTGATHVNRFRVLPSSLRFYAGGDGSIRGFDYKSLGPKDNNQNVIGGKFLLVGGLEYEHPVTSSFGVAAFVDSGNAFDSPNDFRFRSALGIGVRWHSPLGPIRLDLARDLENKHGFRLHLSMGPDL